VSTMRLRASDVAGLGAVGLRVRRTRVALTALGIAIGIAAMVAVLGISASSRADLISELDKLGTNLLEVKPGQDFFGDSATLPTEAAAMVRRIGPVQSVTSLEQVDVTVRRNRSISEDENGGLAVYATDDDRLSALGVKLARGTTLNAATARYPAVILGADAAQTLGIADLRDSPLVWLGDRWFEVVGILEPMPLTPGLDSAVYVGESVAKRLLGADGNASVMYVRATPQQLDAVRNVVAATANPESPNEVDVSRPSDALAARAATNHALTALLLGLGAVALLVAGVGIANVMVISVLERRTEIGVRRALGATRRHVRLQFLVEAVMLAGIGGALGVLLGGGVTAGYAAVRNWTISIPLQSLAGGVAIALVVGALAGLYPASRAARLQPAEAVRRPG
jgi:putative ABC transport system permease protein